MLSLSRLMIAGAFIAVIGIWLHQTFSTVAASASEEQFLEAYRSVAEGSDRDFDAADSLFHRSLAMARDRYVHEIEPGRLASDALLTLDEKRDDIAGTAPREVVEAVMEGVFERLDPHTSYLRASALRSMRETVSGSYAGVGIVITLDEDGLIRVVSPIDDTPAARAGIQPNDRIIGIDAEDMVGRPLSDAVGLMRGPVGQPVTLTIRRGDEPPFKLDMRRARIEVPVVTARRLPDDIGYLRISRFDGTTVDQLMQEASELTQDGPLRGLVMDLRRNPGGLLDQAVGAADAFLTGGVVVTTQGRGGEQLERFDADSAQILPGVPMVVLLDVGSASGAELMAAALRDQGRAVIFGERSFGKGSMQGVIPIDRQAALRLTIGYYATPSGEIVQGSGVAPDLEIRVDHENEIRREGDLDGALPNPTADRRGSVAAIDGAECPAAPLEEDDGAEARPDPILGCAVSYLTDGPIARFKGSLGG